MDSFVLSGRVPSCLEPSERQNYVKGPVDSWSATEQVGAGEEA